MPLERPSPLPSSLARHLAARAESSSLRMLSTCEAGIDFCSNDYLGAARRTDLVHRFTEWFYAEARSFGATGSRLVSGNSRYIDQVEEQIAEFHQVESALLFGSGFEANSSILGCIAERHDTILYDELVHASLREGVRLSLAKSQSFRHNSVEHLEGLIKRRQSDAPDKQIFVAVESLYSMDGDFSPLNELVAVCVKYGAYLIVDEAHATGVYGYSGEGIVQSLGLSEQVFARVHTFGKALGFRGGVVVGSRVLKDYLVNFAKSFVYSTGPDLLSVWGAWDSYEWVKGASSEREQLFRMIDIFIAASKRYPSLNVLSSSSAIQGVVVPGNERILGVERFLQGSGFNVKAIRSPTVPAGLERVRICLHSFNSESDIHRLVDQLANYLSSINSGVQSQ